MGNNKFLVGQQWPLWWKWLLLQWKWNWRSRLNRSKWNNNQQSKQLYIHVPVHGSRKFCQWGSNFDNVFYLVGVSLAWQCSPTLNAGLEALWFFRGSRSVLLENLIFLWFFGGSGPSFPPSGSETAYLSSNGNDCRL